MKAFTSRLLAGLGVAAAAMVLTVAPALAVIGGTPDSANRFSNVALVDIGGQPECTGTLFRTDPSQTTSNLVMTAGHCTSGQTGQFSVTFDPAAPSPASVYYSGVAYTHPNFTFPATKNNSLQGYNTDDVGVIVLSQNVPGITPADLPAKGLVDTFNFKTQLLTVAGYGIDNFTNANTFTYGPRTVKDVGIVPGQRTQIADNFLKVTSGDCSGDSGGPLFVKGSETIAAIVSVGQSYVCSGPAYEFRIDSATALNFLRNPTTVGLHQ